MRFKSPRDEPLELIAIAGPVGLADERSPCPLANVPAITVRRTTVRLKSAPVAAAAAALLPQSSAGDKTQTAQQPSS